MDRTFSVYGHTLTTVRELGGEIQQIGGVDRYEPSAGAGATGFSTRMKGMLHWCRVVERLIVERDLRDAEVQVGFERLSRIQKSQANYESISALVPRLVVLGAPDAPVRIQRAHVVPVIDGPLLEEWFLIVRSNRYSALIAARDLDGLKGGSWDQARRFVAVATHDTKVVDATASALDVAIASGSQSAGA